MREYPKTEYRDGMRIDRDVPIEIDDGIELRCDIYRPPDQCTYPVIMSYGPYGKWLHFEQLYEEQWDTMCEKHPDVPAGSTNKYQVWEVVDPEKWVPDGYAVVRVDSRGAGRSPGCLDVWSQRETRDYAQCIQWAGERDWSNGKVGLNGISYYAMNQWQVAALDPDHLEAMCVWEGAADFYRDLGRHGGIYCTFAEDWYERQVETVQHGVGRNGIRSRITGDWVAGPETLSEEALGSRRADLPREYKTNTLASDEYWASRNPQLEKIEIPLLSAGNWGGHGLHPRGNFEGYYRASSDHKWLEVHVGEHWAEFYTDYGIDLQKRFFDHFLKDEDTGWLDQPTVQLHIREPNGEVKERHEIDWPIPRTNWTRYYLEANDMQLVASEPSTSTATTYEGLGNGVTFLTDPLEEHVEITGPMSAKLFVESDTEDADLFLVVRVFGPDMEEVVFQGAHDPQKPIALGWLRASHRKLDDELSEEWRPYHSHDEEQTLTPGDVYELDIEIHPSCVEIPAGYRIGLSVRGNDYESPGESTKEGLGGKFTGVGPFRHDDPDDRPPETYGGDVTIHAGPDYPSSLLLPVVPEKE